MAEKSYCLYCHTLVQNGKRYIGITRQSPIKRWARGKGYIHNEFFWRNIQKYGWDAFDHEILYKDLTKEKAEELEINLISYYNKTDRNFGFNIHTGGFTRDGQNIPKGADNIKLKAVLQYDLDGNFIREFGGVRDVGRILNLS